MSYGPGDNAFVIDRPSAEGGDKVQIFAEKTKAQLDRLYEQLNSDVHAANENERGLVKIATLVEVDVGIANDSALTPYTFDRSALAETAKNAASKASDNAESIETIRENISALETDIADAEETAGSALAKAQRIEDMLPGGSGQQFTPNMPTGGESGTFRAMPAVGTYPSPDYPSVNIRAIKLPDGGTWAYCGRLDYMWGNNDTENPASASLCGVAAGGTIVWQQTTQNHGNQMRAHQVYGFVWKIS